MITLLLGGIISAIAKAYTAQHRVVDSVNSLQFAKLHCIIILRASQSAMTRKYLTFSGLFILFSIAINFFVLPWLIIGVIIFTALHNRVKHMCEVKRKNKTLQRLLSMQDLKRLSKVQAASFHKLSHF